MGWFEMEERGEVVNLINVNKIHKKNSSTGNFYPFLWSYFVNRLKTLYEKKLRNDIHLIFMWYFDIFLCITCIIYINRELIYVIYDYIHILHVVRWQNK